MPKKSQHEAAQFIAVALGAFKKAGFRITNPRRAVVQALAGSAKPMSVAEILSLVKKKHGPESVDKVSIYRTVEKLIDLSLVHRVGPAGEIFRCAHTACSHAYHLLLSCLSCNEVQELHVGDKAVAPLVEFIRSSQGFQVDPHEIRARGLCARCGAKTKVKGSTLRVLS